MTERAAQKTSSGLAGKEGHISNLSAPDLEAILNFIDRYNYEIQAVNQRAEKAEKSAPCALQNEPSS